ncbi:hypothetical protein TRICI_000122 [Trichomonascus ciferrii]|uniref:Uncharacterized protein n=1 Tax=Trichomonascus ciferrii TaxID=44093 RepID=A0A642VEB8_9ASCO|nr:hypothetical protein TRICI_000122 [Trichomonascus ciferrii]
MHNSGKRRRREGGELTVEPSEILLNSSSSYSPPYPMPLWDDATTSSSGSGEPASADRSPTLGLGVSDDDEYALSEHLLTLESYLTPEPEDDIEAALAAAADHIDDTNNSPFNNDPLGFLSNAINI